MAVGSGIYITWITGAILISIAMMPIFKPPYAKVRIEGFIDMFRRYWAHMIVVFSVYLWKDIFIMSNNHRRGRNKGLSEKISHKSACGDYSIN